MNPNVTFSLNNDALTIFLKDRIDSTNASIFETSIEEISNANPHTSLTLDLDALEYVSSAGLRCFLKLKKTNKDFKIINASLEVYDVLEMTGFTDIMDVAKAYKKFNVEGLEVIGQGAKGIVYRYNSDTIVKVYKNPDCLADIERERNLSKKAFVLGIPTAISYDIVKVGNSYGTVYELLASKSLSKLIASDPSKMDYYVEIFTNLLKEIHATTMNKDVPSAKAKILKSKAITFDILGEELANKLFGYIENIEDSDNLLHMDFHTNNVMMQGEEPLAIDMDTLSYGNIIFELANVFVTYVGFSTISEAMIENFLAMKYCYSKEFYNKFIRLYLGDKCTEENLNKIELLGMMRVLRHVVKRKGFFENEEEIINKCLKRINELAKVVNDFTI